MIETLIFIAIVLVLLKVAKEKYGHTPAGRICGDILENVIRLLVFLCQITLSVISWFVAVVIQAVFSKSNPNKFLNWIKSSFSGFAFPRFGSFLLLRTDKTITDMWKDKPFEFSSVDGIHAPLGWTADGQEIMFELGDDPPHAILAGTAGSGKSNLLHVLIQGLLHRFSPDELNLYLLDYKDGVEFNVYAGAKIPQIKFVATVNDSEYGINALKYFQKEITRRNDEFRNNGARNINEMRKTTGKQIPRWLLIIDEFQVLINDAKVTDEAYDLLSDILKRGRSSGIHVLLATQSLSGLRGTVTGGFDTLKTQLGYRIALKCNQNDSMMVLSHDNLDASTLEAKKEAIINKQNGIKDANVKLNVPCAEPTICTKHLQDISAQLLQCGYVADTKVFNGACLPTVTSLQQFRQCQGKILLGEKLSFEAEPFAFHWERFQGNNLCVAGINDKIRNGILYAVLVSIQQGNIFDRVVYYNSDPNCPTLNSSGFPNVEVKNHTWDCNITTLVSDIPAKRTLLIIDSLDNARLLYPKKKDFVPKPAPTVPADFLKEFLDKGPQSGSFVLAFVDNWGRFNNTTNDYLENFEMYIGFYLKEDDAGSLITGNIGRSFKGLDQPNKAIFVDRQRNTQTLFRPFVSKK